MLQCVTFIRNMLQHMSNPFHICAVKCREIIRKYTYVSYESQHIFLSREIFQGLCGDVDIADFLDLNVCIFGC